MGTTISNTWLYTPPTAHYRTAINSLDAIPEPGSAP
jgi:hypothetical protein